MSVTEPRYRDRRGPARPRPLGRLVPSHSRLESRNRRIVTAGRGAEGSGAEGLGVGTRRAEGRLGTGKKKKDRRGTNYLAGARLT